MRIIFILALLFALACDDECKTDDEECRKDSIWTCENGDWVEILNCAQVIEPDTDGAWTCCEVEEGGEFIPDCVQGGCGG